MEIKTVQLNYPEEVNIILGQTHFIKTAEDLYEILITSVPGIKFGLAFNEASGPCLIRAEGNDDKLKSLAISNIKEIGAGHAFIILIENAFPINVLNAIKQCPEVCHIFCATANPAEVVVAETEQGRGILGVIDGFLPKGIEKEEDIEKRKKFLRTINYKL
ncbi:MAG: adenosine-specific kinase [Candidatus Atribacteria bacterium]|nr:adenosine-specific kinase [Candidatus Atribacteria bacterium]